MTEKENLKPPVSNVLLRAWSLFRASCLGFRAYLALILALSGCGYKSDSGDDSNGYHWQSLYRQDIRTVAVPIFTTRSFDRGAEFNLSQAVVKQIEATTPYKVVPRERADTILEGQVVDVQVGTLSTDPNSAIPQEQMLGMTIDFTWKDLRSGRVLVERRGFEHTATYYPTLGEGRTLGRQQAVERLALAIVQELQADW
jgi:hypothetical protein